MRRQVLPSARIVQASSIRKAASLFPFPNEWARRLGRVFAGWVCVVAMDVYGQDGNRLPDESVLPGASEPQTELPSEAELPGRQRVVGAQMPGEDELPGVPAKPISINPNPPILRLAFDGHTSLIRTIDLDGSGRTMVSGGDDKDLHVWERTDVNRSGWLHRRSIRWPVSRGPRGTIYTAKLRNDWVAFAGFGAFGGAGEIRIANTSSGELLQTLTVEDEIGVTMLALAWSPSKSPRLASLNMQGRLLDWQPDPTTGIWQAKEWVAADRETYGDEIATELLKPEYRSFGAVTFLGEHYLVVPKLNLDSEDDIRVWHLERIDLRNGQRVVLKQMDHRFHVRCLTVTPDGRTMASVERGDEDGSNVGVWRFTKDGDIESFEQFAPSNPPIDADLSDSGSQIVIGTEFLNDTPASVEVWDLTSTAKRTGLQSVADNAYAVAFDENHRQIIATQGNSILDYELTDEAQIGETRPAVLRPPVAPVIRVAFEKGDGYRFAFGWTRDAEGDKQIEAVFDLAESKLMGRSPVEPKDFLPSQRTATRWVLTLDEQNRYRLVAGDQQYGALPIDPIRNGWPSSICTLPLPSKGNEDPGELPATGAVIVGTQGQGNIYVYRADRSDPPELLRQFRGQTDVLSVSTSSDGKYLVSGSADSTMAVWNLDGVFSASRMMNRWGAEFEVEGDRLVVAKVDEAGPMYFRGVREGDQLAVMSWIQLNELPVDETDAKKLRERLLDLPFDTMVKFKFRRLSRAGPTFQSYPAWRPLATLFVDQHREWAYWTPAGYYDASFNGHQNFGWQLNPINVSDPVKFFRAAQYRKQLERPDVMRSLLESGSLPEAMRNTVAQIGPPPAEGAIVNQIETQPSIQLLSPDPSKPIDGDRLIVTAAISVPVGATLVDPRAFVSGVPAIDTRIITKSQEIGKNVTTYQFQFRLPSDRQLQLELLAATQSEAIGRLLVDLDHRPSNHPKPKPRLHVLAIGASQYRDPQIQSLDFAANAADKITQLFEEKSSAIYQTSGDALTDTDATRPLWRVFAQSAAEQLAQTVSPDDLVIMYLCGHGLRDRRTNQWYFVAADARFSDLMNDQYEDCISFGDLAAFSKLPCRKLAILDSCHSGAIQPVMRRDDLKSALRFLQEDLVLTITASEGDEEAAEQKESRLGRFTTALIDALNGKAVEIDGDGHVSLSEVIRYVNARVTQESEAEGMPQHPTASPQYLLQTLQLPLTAR
ncbi:MAG: caspase family protein [Planctomycetota bacterium]